ncbi:MAG: hypothetical protein AAF501_05075 [Pseudomonadota bacterium]
MKPRLLVHIGGAKCGSTSIQTFAALNRRRLLTEGVLVPTPQMTFERSPDGDQVWFFQNLIGQQDGPRILGERLEALIEENGAQRRGFFGGSRAKPRVLLSAENLSNPNGLHKTFAALANDFEIHVLLYIRRQEDAFMSGWQQWFVKTEADLDQWIDQTTGFFADWRRTINDWMSIGATTMNVRLFDRSLLEKQDLVHDFLHWISVRPARLKFHNSFVNVSHGAHIAELMHDCRALFTGQHDTFFEHQLFEMKIKSAAKRSGEVVFTREQIEKVRARYQDDNAWIKERYFPDLERDVLFPPMDYSKVSKPDQAEINRRNRAVISELIAKMPDSVEGRETLALQDPAGLDRNGISALMMKVIGELKVSASA